MITSGESKKKRFLGFTISDSMFSTNAIITRKEISTREFMEWVEAGEVIPVILQKHKFIVDALQSRYGIKIELLDKLPEINFQEGDSLVVMQVRGLPPYNPNCEYTAAEIISASFSFSLWKILSTFSR